MERRFGLISVDDHVQEHPKVWTERLARRWGDRAPHIDEAGERWLVDGEPIPLDGVAQAGVLLMDRRIEPQQWDDVPEAAYVPAQRLKAMDADGVDCSV